ncbi:MAG TPA: Smr/MutS family protein [Anaeromyxobacteraceae bacterium]|nr:Smr/MutS family protein [Anaeromyxobacteraceae bacterium]
MSKKPFHNPFEKLAGLRKELGAPPPKAKPQPPPPPPPPRERTEAELWAEATAGARKVDQGPGQAAPPAPRGAPDRVWYADLDAIDELRALVSGEGPFDISDGDEFIEGRVAGLDQAIVRKLRRGDYAVQGHLDLHGLTREEAKTQVDAFLRASRQGGKRCVVLVHGRGLHSRDQLPVLKDALRTWLGQGRFARHVLAFATARPADGGAGAVYVLLRRAGR